MASASVSFFPPDEWDDFSVWDDYAAQLAAAVEEAQAELDEAYARLDRMKEEGE